MCIDALIHDKFYFTREEIVKVLPENIRYIAFILVGFLIESIRYTALLLVGSCQRTSGTMQRSYWLA